MALNPEDDPDYKGKDAEAQEDKDSSGADIKEDDENKKTLNPDDIEKSIEAEKAASVAEDPKETYYFVGLRYRAHIIPKFMMNLFGDGGATVVANGFGPEVTIRKDKFEYVLSAFWTGYYMPWTPFKGSSDSRYAWERVKSDINILYFTADFNWTVYEPSPAFGVNFGLGAGLGYVWGNLGRRQAWPENMAAYKNPDTYASCDDPRAGGNPHIDPRNGQAYCDLSNHHYGDYNEPSWANGGQKPMLFPWLAIGPGFRIKPHRHVMFRVDMGWALVGPFIGIAGNYGI
jgi:hypothetical protein